VSDIDLIELYERLLRDREAPRKLIDAAACVANAIAVGAGGMIQGTLMEADLRRCLCLKPGELVNIPK
jgi:hypothetical protein